MAREWLCLALFALIVLAATWLVCRRLARRNAELRQAMLLENPKLFLPKSVWKISIWRVRDNKRMCTLKCRGNTENEAVADAMWQIRGKANDRRYVYTVEKRPKT